jgi:hypothetical protein
MIIMAFKYKTEGLFTLYTFYNTFYPQPITWRYAEAAWLLTSLRQFPKIRPDHQKVDSLIHLNSVWL